MTLLSLITFIWVMFYILQSTFTYVIAPGKINLSIFCVCVPIVLCNIVLCIATVSLCYLPSMVPTPTPRILFKMS